LARVFRDVEELAENSTRAEPEFPSSAIASPARTVIAFASARGGVGKSSILLNLAAPLAQAGVKVGVLDADLNSPTIGAMLGMKPVRRSFSPDWLDPGAGPLGLRIAGSDFLPDTAPAPINFANLDEPPIEETNGARPPLDLGYSKTLVRLLTQTRFGAIDLLLLDLPPGIEALIRLARIDPHLQVIAVTHPSEIAARSLRAMLDIAAERSLRVFGAMENMAGFDCAGCHAVRPLMPQGAISSVLQVAGVPLLGRLPFDPRFAECTDHGSLFVRDYPETPLAKQLIEIARTIARTLEIPMSATAHHA
jgi:ATP-binding protein involved in chromosome partitioning